ncbi:MAG: hypothetical protein AAGC54_07595, partial [Cyanobacteria bacterium P01_F01_bin.4]
MTTRYTDYNNWAWLYNKTMGPDYSQPQLDLLNRVLLPDMPERGHILDLCCGTGQLIPTVHPQVLHFIGLKRINRLSAMSSMR